MEILLTIIHLLACLILVVVVLLQKGKGADLAGAFGGGGSQTALGVRSAAQLIQKLTIGAAVFFMITSYTLGLIQSTSKSLAAEVESEAGALPAPAQNEDQSVDEQQKQDSNVPPDENTGDTDDKGGGEQPSSQEQGQEEDDSSGDGGDQQQ